MGVRWLGDRCVPDQAGRYWHGVRPVREIREFLRKDIPEVADLWQRVFRQRKATLSKTLQTYLQAESLQTYLQTYFEEVFFRNPWYDESLPSLVCEDDSRKIIGFLGVIPRRMTLEGRPVRVAVSTQFMVDAGRRPGLAAIELLRRFFSGPQDLALTDGANESSQRVWRHAGGEVALLYSLEWVRVLRPTRFVMWLLARRRRLLAPLAWTSRPICCALDGLAARMPLSPFRLSVPASGEEEIAEETLLWCLSQLSGRQGLRPEYGRDSLRWLLGQTGEMKRHGMLRKVVVRDADGEIIGWYIYYSKPSGVSQVLQLGARERAVPLVLDHLFYHARRLGAVAVRGRLEPRLVRELSDSRCMITCRTLGVLIHSRDRELLDTIHRGDAFLTRLEGEWWLRFGEIAET
jgi:hypothetical protein